MKTHRKYLIFLFVSISLDRVITILFWDYEKNAMVRELGVTWWLITTLFIFIMLSEIYISWQNTEYESLGNKIVLGLTGIHLFTFITNLIVVLLR